MVRGLVGKAGGFKPGQANTARIETGIAVALIVQRGILSGGGIQGGEGTAGVIISAGVVMSPGVEVVLPSRVVMTE